MIPGILIVDDNTVMRTMLANYLGYKAPLLPIASCARAATALELSRSVAMACALVDYCLPDGDGITLAQDLLAHWPHMAILLLTGHTQTRLHRDAYEAGCVDVLVKPISLPMLWDAMQPFLTGDVSVLPPDALVTPCRLPST